MWTLITQALAETPVHHDLDVALDPAAHRVAVTDTLTLNDAPRTEEGFPFVLHAGLAPRVTTRGWKLLPLGPAQGAEAPLEAWLLAPRRKRAMAAPVTLTSGGPIFHEPVQVATEHQRSFATSPGIIDERGAVLHGGSYWIPTFREPSAQAPSGLVTFELDVRGLPQGWEVVSQGERSAVPAEGGQGPATRWRMAHPTEEVHLVAGPLFSYATQAVRPDGTSVEVRALLRSEDPALANRYLGATRRYLELYEGMLPRYPYPSFSLVENFWETGYGMPGFTLLGSEVIRFPFVLTSSYPHELLHNWWGNGAYVDYSAGNWCEGLTSYMADHLFSEQRGEDIVYRRSTLQRYTDFVGEGDDRPLDTFVNRNSAASEALGYGKSLMIFHMLRTAVGDEAWLRALGKFYTSAAHRRARFEEIGAALSAEAGTDLGPWLQQWTSRSGAPQLAIGKAEVREEGGGFVLELSVRQEQAEDPFPLRVPVAVTLEGEKEPQWVTLSYEVGGQEREVSASFSLPNKPLRVDVDPRFDLMRRLDPHEVPPALSTLFGEGQETFVLPASAGADEREAWKTLAAAWAAPAAPTLVLDDALTELPSGNVWVLGWDNRFAAGVAERAGGGLGPGKVRVGGQELPRKGNSAVMLARGAADPKAVVGLVAADPIGAIPALTRKLPHYTRYSYLAFAGAEAQNTVKGMTEPQGSPLTRNLTSGPLAPLSMAPRPPLAELPSLFDGSAISKTAAALSSLEMEGRGPGSSGLERAMQRAEEQLKALGLSPERSPFPWKPNNTGPSESASELANLVVTVPGTDPSLAPVLVMAHLDHLGKGEAGAHEGDEGKVHPGADDNASGVAVALDLARVVAAEPARARPVIFAFTNAEEEGLLGSRALLRAMEGAPFACVNLDAVGRKAGAPIQVIGADSAREWRFALMGITHTTGIQTAPVPGELASSDQAACHERGVPGVHLFTAPHADYHRPSDTADKLDTEGMVDVAEVAHGLVSWLAERKEPLTHQLSGGAASAPASGTRKASLGTMPDFAFAGPGVRVAEVLQGSAAAQVGIAAGDVIVSLAGAKISDLRAFSEALAARQPGEKVEVRLQRGGKVVVVQATLGAR